MRLYRRFDGARAFKLADAQQRSIQSAHRIQLLSFLRVRPYSIPLWSKPTRSNMQLTPCGNMSLRLRTALHCTALHCTALHCTALHCTQWSSRLFRHSRSLQLAAVLTGRRTLAAVRPPVRRHSAAGRVDLHATASAIGGMCGPSGQRSNGAAQRV